MNSRELSVLIASTCAYNVAENIRRSRLAQNISQAEIATHVGMSLRSYQTFESTGEIRLNKFIEVLRALGRLQEFVDTAHIFRPQTFAEAERLSERRQRARKSAKRLPD